MADENRFPSIRALGAFSLTALALAGCGAEGPLASLNLGLGQQEDELQAPPAGGENTVKTVERDVEAPEVFEVNDRALWDGRPSLGGVWVAHPDNKEPERVIIRNEANGKFVIGALFRRERDLPGPSLQLSSDAATALGVQAGSPTKLRVTALRREEVPVEPVATQEPTPADVEGASTETVTARELDSTDTRALASAALASIETAKPVKTTAPANSTTAKPPTPAATKSASTGVKKPYVQIGYFSVEGNAKANVASMKANGVPARMVSSTTNGKTFWRVIAGPAASGTEQRQLMNMVKQQGFSDAYFVKG